MFCLSMFSHGPLQHKPIDERADSVSHECWEKGLEQIVSRISSQHYSVATLTRFPIYSVSFPVDVRKVLLSLKICIHPVPSPVAI